MYYTWAKADVVVPPNACASEALTSGCGGFAGWFWIAAAVAGALLVAGRK